MAETPESIANEFPPITLADSAKYTAEIFKAFKEKARIVKIYDTCMARFGEFVSTPPEKLHQVPEVFYCDFSCNRRIFLQKPHKDCSSNCTHNIEKSCISEVNQMKVIEYSDLKKNFYENLE